jgi:hypothetical protein
LSENLVAPGIKPGTPACVARNSDPIEHRGVQTLYYHLHYFHMFIVENKTNITLRFYEKLIKIQPLRQKSDLIFG